MMTFVETDVSTVDRLLERDSRELDCDIVVYEEEGDIRIGLIVMLASGDDFNSKFRRNFSRPMTPVEG